MSLGRTPFMSGAFFRGEAQAARRSWSGLRSRAARCHEGSSTDLEEALSLASPAWRFLAARHVHLALPLGDVREHRPEPLVFDDRRLINLPDLVEDPVGQGPAFMLDGKSTVRIVKHHDALAGEGPGDLARLKHEQHFVILKR